MHLRERKTPSGARSECHYLQHEPPRQLLRLNDVMESLFSSVTSEVADRVANCGEAKMELVDYIEVFYNQRRRHSTLGQISPAAFERRATQAA
jgi:transposase InsO family protein